VGEENTYCINVNFAAIFARKILPWYIYFCGCAFMKNKCFLFIAFIDIKVFPAKEIRFYQFLV
jgi:hypothetical protein